MGPKRCRSWRGPQLRLALQREFESAGGLATFRTIHDRFSAFTRPLKAEAALYGRSIFCPAVPGDTDTSKRLFCAILAGCIPVIVGNHPQLPFTDRLHWDSFSIRVSEEAALQGGVLPRLQPLMASGNGSEGQDVQRLQSSLAGARKRLGFWAHDVYSGFDAIALLVHTVTDKR